KKLYETVVKEYKTTQVFPPSRDLFKAYELCPYHKVKVVILGQDPYHNVGQAQGMSFSVPKGVPLPPSLQNIFKEIRDDLSILEPDCGDLSYWAKQGVLLLNTVLTVRAHQAFSHRGIGWEEFTDATIRAIEEKEDPVVYILWGAPAQKKRSMIRQKKRLVLTAPHPSPLSAYRGFFGSKPFSKCNAYLRKEGVEEIDWQLPSSSSSAM
ncbi:MAG: uracil-DNA glycosylase, partial [Lachnospiraceae bacterium]|nr:uracil-DNA glycosylase [Lachnospiraceae bacterium]